MQTTNSLPQTDWHGKPYYSLDAFCKNTYGEKLYKIALDAGLSCPNRDGALDTRGCIFCSAGGSGDFAQKLSAGDISCGYDIDFHTAFEKSRMALSGKQTGQRFIDYFQAYTNTYGPVSYLEKIYEAALRESLVAGISIATRPDCLPPAVIELLIKSKSLYPDKFIWVELGLQTIHERTATFIRRGYPQCVFERGMSRLHAADIPIIVHVILGLPGENMQDMLATIQYLNQCPIWGIKLQLLHILKDTDLGRLYAEDPSACGSFENLDDYLTVLISCLGILRPDIVIHRLTGDAPKEALLFPLWSADKRKVLNTLHKIMKEQNIYQGKKWQKAL